MKIRIKPVVKVTVLVLLAPLGVIAGVAVFSVLTLLTVMDWACYEP